MSDNPLTAAPRLKSVDAARFIGIVLVFFGHLVEQVMYLENPAAAAQYKWVYSFHMPLFFLLAGTVFSDLKVRTGLGAFLKRRWSSRLVPYFFFSALIAGLSLVIPGWFPTVDLSSVEGYIQGAVSTLKGVPAFNIPLWFLGCLVGVEILHFCLARFWTSMLRLACAALVFYLFGYYLNLQVDFFSSGLVFWLLNLVPLGYAFYLTGLLIKRSGVLAREFSRWQLLIGAGICLVGVFLTYDLNQGPFRLLEAVVLLLGAPGHVLLFPLTALMGIALVLILAKLAPDWPLLHHLGENTLLIYCLHGIFYHFVNPPLAAWMVGFLPAAGWSIFIFGALATILSVALTVPLAILIKRYIPQVIGAAPAGSTMASPAN